MKTIPFGVANLEYYDNQGNLIMVGNTFTDTALQASASELEIRSGQGGGLQAVIYHSTAVNITATDIHLDLNYFAHKFGTQIEYGGTEFAFETITTTLNKITVMGVPVEFAEFGLIGWYKLKNETDEEWKKINFIGKDATVAIASGVEVCVKYNATKLALRQIKIPVDMIPDVLYVKMFSKLFKSTSTGQVDTSSSEVGRLVIDIPKFQFNPNTSLSMNMSSNSVMEVSGRALINKEYSCNGGNDYYATIKEDIYGANWYDDAEEIKVVPTEVDLTTGETELLQVYVLYKTGVWKQIANSEFVFTSSDTGVATIVNGVVTYVAVGETAITVTVTAKPSLIDIVQVTCS